MSLCEDAVYGRREEFGWRSMGGSRVFVLYYLLSYLGCCVARKPRVSF